MWLSNIVRVLQLNCQLLLTQIKASTIPKNVAVKFNVNVTTKTNDNLLGSNLYIEGYFLETIRSTQGRADMLIVQCKFKSKV